ncbi:unnamed protein product [Caenorhabditis bovis]|uniref:Uncharacterized protein n=1 Tax=Caenorhabditis bovis TaxID=2654633 RepID=A0A8S1F9B5_9PELO|nr:unnamed protein product [Caenorhabditis bovis]
MMTGFGNAGAQSLFPGLSDNCGSHQFFTGLDLTTTANVFASTGSYAASPRYNMPIAEGTKVENAPAHISITDEELYEALNISPIVPTTSTNNHHRQNSKDFFPSYSPMDGNMLAASSDYCYPSTSSLEQAMTPFENHAMYLPPDMISLGPSPMRELASPTFSVHSFAPTTSTTNAEEEDLEVELINTAICEPQRELPEGIEIFLRAGTSDNEFRSSECTTYSESSGSNPTPSERPAYAKKLSASVQKTNSVDIPPSVTSPLFLQTSLDPTGFTPLLTPKSNELLQKKLSEATAYPHFESNITPRREPYQISDCLLFKKPLLPARIEQKYKDCQAEPIAIERLCDYFNFTADQKRIDAPERKRAHRHNQLPRDIHPVAEEVPVFSDLEFEESQVGKLTLAQLPDCLPPKPAQSPDCCISQQSTRPPTKKLCVPVATMDAKKPDDNVVDDWETADDEELTSRMEKLLHDVKQNDKRTEEIRKMESVPSTSDWDPNKLPNVIEVYGIPDYKMQDDVVRALESIGYGDAKLKWIERKIVLASFDSNNRAKQCINVMNHEWLRFRALKYSPKCVQEAAIANAATLTAPKKRAQTNASVARRMVENILGQKSNVSADKRREERKQIADARAAKKNIVQWD